MVDLVLASTSRHRRELLERLRVPFRIEAPGVDEAAVKRSLLEPEQVAAELARAKAAATAARHPGAVVIGSDQVAASGSEVFDKPGSAAAAVAQLERLQGRQHRLVTAVAVVHGARTAQFADTTLLTMRELDRTAIERYVAADRPFDCAGSYRIEGLGITLFERVEGSDWTAIVGLPLLRLCAELRAFGVLLP